MTPDADPSPSSSSSHGATDDTEVIGASSSSMSAQRSLPIARGACVGRYIVLDLVGAGGMGEVYAAFDPQLDRKVALKVLRVRGAESPDGTRVLREARSLARLNHPNVVAVYDASTADENVHIAMEFVEGRTLTQWLREGHDWREVLAVLVSAGEGLVAAHATGLVHRDFKPDNVMIGADARVRVMDFGLARVAIGHDSLDPVISSAASAELPIELTATGTLVGTPGYLAPEVYAGEGADERADQFSFCVTLWWGLFGERPFAGEVAFEIAAASARGDFRAPPPSSAVPSWLRKVVERGLMADPHARWPDMRTLLVALQRDPSRRRRWALGLGALGLAAAAAIGFSFVREAARVEACEREAHAIDEVWNEVVAETVRAQFGASGLVLAEPTFDRVRARLDDYASRWSLTQREICLQPAADSPAVQLQRSCMQTRQAALAKTVDVLVHAEPADVIAAIGAAARQRPVEDCQDTAALSLRAATTGADGASPAAAQLERQGAEIGVLLDLGRASEAIALAQTTVDAADQLDAPALAAAARAQLGDALFVDAPDRARAELETAYFAASGLGDDRIAAATATRLLVTVGELLGKTEDGLLWGRLAQAAIERTPGDTKLLRAQHMSSRARVRQTAGDFAGAVADAETVLTLYEEIYGADHPVLGGAANTLGTIYLAQGDDVRAAVALERALRLAEQAFGPSHPEVARYLHNLAGVHYRRGDLARARALTERSLEIKRQWLGSESRDVANSLNALGNLAMQDDDLPEAQRMFEQSVAIYRKIHDGDHPNLAELLANLAHAHASQRHFDAAEQLYRERLAMVERLHGPAHPKLADALANLGTLRADRGQRAEAVQLLRRALAIYNAAVPGDYPTLVDALIELGQQLLVTGHEREALEHLQRATTTLDARPAVDPLIHGRARHWLARATWAVEHDAARARELAELARTDYASASAGAKPELEQLERWLADVPAPQR